MPNIETLSPEDFKAEIALEDTTLIDVRTSWELVTYWVISQDQLHIDISLPNVTQKIEVLDPKGKYLIYCWHGVRSKQVMDYMQSQWFKYVKDLDWGIDKWNNML
jgi:rhodanese-related sulfurtransferase